MSLGNIFVWGFLYFNCICLFWRYIYFIGRKYLIKKLSCINLNIMHINNTVFFKVRILIPFLQRIIRSPSEVLWESPLESYPEKSSHEPFCLFLHCIFVLMFDYPIILFCDFLQNFMIFVLGTFSYATWRQ